MLNCIPKLYTKCICEMCCQVLDQPQRGMSQNIGSIRAPRHLMGVTTNPSIYGIQNMYPHHSIGTYRHGQPHQIITLVNPQNPYQVNTDSNLHTIESNQFYINGITLFLIHVHGLYSSLSVQPSTLISVFYSLNQLLPTAASL